MPADSLIDRSLFDPATVVADLEEIRKVNPQRYEMEQLTRICYAADRGGEVAGVLEVPADPWWARGHVPGRPLMPGVLMVEAAAQLCSFAVRYAYDPAEFGSRFFGFGGIDGVKFRGTVFPGDRLLILGKRTELRPRRAIYQTEGYVGDRRVFEAQITGMWV